MTRAAASATPVIQLYVTPDTVCPTASLGYNRELPGDERERITHAMSIFVDKRWENNWLALVSPFGNHRPPGRRNRLRGVSQRGAESLNERLIPVP